MPHCLLMRFRGPASSICCQHRRPWLSSLSQFSFDRSLPPVTCQPSPRFTPVCPPFQDNAAQKNDPPPSGGRTSDAKTNSGCPDDFLATVEGVIVNDVACSIYRSTCFCPSSPSLITIDAALAATPLGDLLAADSTQLCFPASAPRPPLHSPQGSALEGPRTDIGQARQGTAPLRPRQETSASSPASPATDQGLTGRARCNATRPCGCLAFGPVDLPRQALEMDLPRAPSKDSPPRLGPVALA
ncbi:hypothetical protein F5X68DRAFT_11693 [Plectosphaerella plurivora]|uniref:Uncharacterized protein n=1 Tax=Plectosphaerella plurivora TaxID=936078 RepID=A0A9P8V9E7_9PEZI|nr:hypothetical protein F5X68DRAFT_11693 [Plectosphaerella plurivora]